MEWLNYHHLLYFWTVVRKGGVSKAAEELRLSQPTISAQVKQLEGAIGEPLFARKGRDQVLTDVGRLVYHHADEIFGIGKHLLEALHGRTTGRAIPLTIGVANAVPKLVVYRLLRPVLEQRDAIRIICREDDPEQLMGLLATYAMDVVIANAPAPTYLPVKVFNHLLGESEIAFFAPAALTASLKRRFPRSLHETPMLLPTSNSPLRRAIEEWFESTNVRPQVVGEFEDSALMTVVGQEGGCVFPAPAAIERDVHRIYGARMIGRTTTVRESYYVITAERRLRHPGVVALTTEARAKAL